MSHRETRNAAHLARGNTAELAAVKFLEAKGLRTVARNVNYRGGEIDIISRDDSGGVIFVEVRFRSNSAYGSPAESVTIQKQNKIIQSARNWLQTNDPTGKYWCRFDVICVSPNQKNAFDIDWISDAFSE